MKRLLVKFWGWIKPYLTPRMIPIILSIWLMTNGIWYIIGFSGIEWFPVWLRHFAKGYIVFLYTPWAPEKILIILIATRIYKK